MCIICIHALCALYVYMHFLFLFLTFFIFINTYISLILLILILKFVQIIIFFELFQPKLILCRLFSLMLSIFPNFGIFKAISAGW